MFVVFLVYLELKMNSVGGPPLVLTVFFTLLILPNVLYAYIVDDGDHALAVFTGSTVLAIAVASFMYYRYTKIKKKRQNDQTSRNQNPNPFLSTDDTD